MDLIFVTGARGAIGQHVVALARSRGHRVAGLGHGAWQDNAVQPTIDAWINGGIDVDNLAELTRIAGPPDLVVHLAGGSLVGASIAHPGEDFRRTVESAQHLLEWLRTSAPETRLVIASSAAVYGNAHKGPIRELTPYEPTSPYGTHKAMVEMMAHSYAQQFHLQIAVIRLFSVYGPGLRKQLIWELTNRLLRGERNLLLGGSGQEQRDFLHIDDAAAMLLNAGALADRSAITFNGCTGHVTSIGELAGLLNSRFDGATVQFSGHGRPGDPFSLVGDVHKTHTAGLTAVIPFETGLVETLDWIEKAVAGKGGYQ